MAICTISIYSWYSVDVYNHAGDKICFVLAHFVAAYWLIFVFWLLGDRSASEWSMTPKIFRDMLICLILAVVGILSH